jgi:peptidyl-tRNA hydrolase
LLERWRAGGARKVVLAVQDLDGMNELHASVPSGCYSSIVTDAGLTEVAVGTQTVVGILGPRRTMDTLLRHLESL